MLEIKNLHVEVDGREVLKGINLHIGHGEKHAIMGENGSGKSTLGLAIAGHPRYKITEGDILFQGKSILNLDVSERARLGMFMTMQNPVEIEGLRYGKFLTESRKALSSEFNIINFQKEMKDRIFDFALEEHVLNRSVNLGLSGGEKKKSEMLQLSLLQPKFAIFDEIDSGLDIDALKNISLKINEFMDKNKGCLLITHYQRVLEHVKPDFVHVLLDGKIVKTGNYELAEEIEKFGYENLK
ncbi:MAG: Fe-S cluster assembly ATPase SufC [Nanoarchaeota archaeon]